MKGLLLLLRIVTYRRGEGEPLMSGTRLNCFFLFFFSQVRYNTATRRRCCTVTQGSKQACMPSWRHDGMIG
ncbi:hypothetical protein BC939DRAFT_464548 [Gamsiella multidivaricata]|uniref:uncharacterized protein n=1 Tax=Gamsiella multidivaricata TaxID=101098 RepID=UPI0022206D0B|nr:uncharacterized protein BC939DRAFT_464548 [Gamsiella multidivaricata]KAI7817832.1 hypothetical protein BC939DRAFT_464548 [Gamsiella multidivaricata]